MKKKFFIPEKYLELVFGLGASVVIIGALLKITHKDFIFSGNTWLTAGLITEAVIFMIAGLRGYAVTGDDDNGDAAGLGFSGERDCCDRGDSEAMA